MKKLPIGSTDSGRSQFTELEQLPNIGPAIAADLKLLGLGQPKDLIGRDPYAMFEELCRLTEQRHDPCLLDTFIAAVSFMSGDPARPWWKYTTQRKKELDLRKQQAQSAG